MTELSIPFRDQSDLTLDVITAAGETLEGADLRVVEQLVFDAFTRGRTKVADLFRELEAVGPAGRRRLVDQARENLGMESLADEEGHRAFEAANRGLRPGRDPEGRIYQGCHAPNCQAVPLDDQGRPIPVAASRWFCGKHVDQAQRTAADLPRPRSPAAGEALVAGNLELPPRGSEPLEGGLDDGHAATCGARASPIVESESNAPGVGDRARTGPISAASASIAS